MEYYVTISTNAVEKDWYTASFTTEEIAEFDFSVDLSDYTFTGDVYDTTTSWYIQNN